MVIVALQLRQWQRARRRVQWCTVVGGSEREKRRESERQCRLKSPARFVLLPSLLPHLESRLRHYEDPRFTTQAKVLRRHERTAPRISRHSKPWALRSIQPRPSSTALALQQAACKQKRAPSCVVGLSCIKRALLCSLCAFVVRFLSQ